MSTPTTAIRRPLFSHLADGTPIYRSMKNGQALSAWFSFQQMQAGPDWSDASDPEFDVRPLLGLDGGQLPEPARVRQLLSACRTRRALELRIEYAGKPTPLVLYFAAEDGSLRAFSLEEEEIPWPCWEVDENGEAFPFVVRHIDQDLAGARIEQCLADRAPEKPTYVGWRYACWDAVAVAETRFSREELPEINALLDPGWRDVTPVPLPEAARAQALELRSHSLSLAEVGRG